MLQALLKGPWGKGNIGAQPPHACLNPRERCLSARAVGMRLFEMVPEDSTINVERGWVMW